MLISLNWIREFVDLPEDLSAAELAERFTLACAEVEKVEPIEVGAKGLVCAAVVALEVVDADRGLRAARLDVGGGVTVDTVTAAANVGVGDRVVFAPVGACVKALGVIADSEVAGRPSSGMIVPGDAIGIAMALREAIHLPPSVETGTVLDEAGFDDWVIEVDNHSINHRPDLWGHYGLAREFAAIFGSPLKPYSVASLESLQDASLPEIPIDIDDADACPRYSGLLMRGVTGQPAPLWMQLRLGHVGLRPISCLVDLTNYVMLELGQPMHAFDGDKVQRIEVGFVDAGTHFTTLDGVDRKLPGDALMILSDRKPVALAGVMGGADTEISDATETILLESANFHPHTIRKCAAHLSHRTDASARFEKSLDPEHTVLAIQRFFELARPEFEELSLASRLSDAFVKPFDPVTITIDPEYVQRVIGHPVSGEEIARILTALEFKVSSSTDAAGRETMVVDVPSFRATRDIEIEADIIEEVARYIGFNNIAPAYPDVMVRALTVNPVQQLEGKSLRLFTGGLGMVELYRYIWYDATWSEKLGYDASHCLALRNPAAAGLERLRDSLVPGLLAAVEHNRHHFQELRFVELGGAFPCATNGAGCDGKDSEHTEVRRIGLMIAARGKNAEDTCLADMRGVVDAWSLSILERPATFEVADADASRPWEHPAKTSSICVGGKSIGRVSAIPLVLRQRIDEHLAAWGVAWAEFDLAPLTDGLTHFEPLASAPSFPEAEIDFSVLADASRRYSEIKSDLATFDDPLLRRITFVDSFEGKSVPDGKRSFTFRCHVGHSDRTMTDDDLSRFREAFQNQLTKSKLEAR